MKSYRGESMNRFLTAAALVWFLVLHVSSLPAAIQAAGQQLPGQGIGQRSGGGVVSGVPNQQPAPPAKGSISGSVVKASSGEVLGGAQITLTRIGDVQPVGSLETSAAPAGRGGNATAQAQPARQRQDPVIIPAVKADDEGRFIVADIPAGTYRVAAARNGYTQQQYGQRSYGRPGTAVTVAAGQQVKDINFRLIPAGTIVGRVTDVKGEPLPGVTVQAMRSTYDATGKRSLQPAGNAKTNDLGEYRLYWMNPGRYFVNANAAPQGLEALSALSTRAAAAQAPSTPEEAQLMAQSQSILGPGRNPNEESDTGFVMTYFPGTPDAARASAVDLQPGAEVRGIDFALPRDRKVRIRGKIVDSSTGKWPENAQVTVSSRDGSSSALDFLGAIGGALQGNTYDPSTGEFEIKEVSSGGYFLQVMSQGGPAPAGPNADISATLSGISNTQVPVDVYGADIENLIVTITPGVTIPGRVRLEGAPVNAPNNPGQNDNPFRTFSVSLSSPSGGGPLLMALLGGTSAGRPAADGTFSLQRVTPGDYKVSVSGLGPNMYVKEARLDQTDILGGVKIGDRINGQLELTLSYNAGSVEGTITDVASKPVSGVQAVLIPDQRERRELFKTAITDQSGKVTFRGVTPGTYRLFAWEDLEPYSYFDPEVLRQYEQQGKLVNVKESANAVIDMKIIPASVP